MKKIALFLMMAAVSVGTAFAAKKSNGIGMYVRGSLGYANWNVESEGVNHFSIEPVFGVTNIFPVEGLGIEAFVDCNFGSKSMSNWYWNGDLNTQVFAPGARAMFARSIGSFTGDKGILDQIVPYAGAGFCLPIVHWSIESKTRISSGTAGGSVTQTVTYSDTTVKFDADFVTGCAFRFTDQFAAHGEFALRFGGIFAYSFRIGGAFKIK